MQPLPLEALPKLPALHHRVAARQVERQTRMSAQAARSDIARTALLHAARSKRDARALHRAASALLPPDTASAARLAPKWEGPT